MICCGKGFWCWESVSGAAVLLIFIAINNPQHPASIHNILVSNTESLLYFDPKKKMKIITLVVLSLMMNCSTSSITVKDMQVNWTAHDDHWAFELKAPTTGWVALGFNHKNDIVHTNLIMGAVEEGQLKIEDFYVVGFGNPQPVNQLGGAVAITEMSGDEQNGQTTIRYHIPKVALDKYHYNLETGKELWFICAYSRDDDFGHHSMMRQHVKVKL